MCDLGPVSLNEVSDEAGLECPLSGPHADKYVRITNNRCGTAGSNVDGENTFISLSEAIDALKGFHDAAGGAHLSDCQSIVYMPTVGGVKFRKFVLVKGTTLLSSTTDDVSYTLDCAPPPPPPSPSPSPPPPAASLAAPEPAALRRRRRHVRHGLPRPRRGRARVRRPARRHVLCARRRGVVARLGAARPEPRLFELLRCRLPLHGAVGVRGRLDARPPARADAGQRRQVVMENPERFELVTSSTGLITGISPVHQEQASVAVLRRTHTHSNGHRRS